MFYVMVLHVLFFIKYISSEPLIDFPRWYSKSKPENTSKYKTIFEYLKIGNCQSITNKCNEYPTYPIKRAYHVAVTYRTYSQEEANELCPSNMCGPFCNSTSDNCLSKRDYPNYPIPEKLELTNYNPPSSSNCPGECCLSNDEYCYRLINNAGNEVYPEQEMMLVFGGLVLNKIKFELNGTEKDVVNNCDEIFESLETMNLKFSTEENLNLLYLINNCGYDLTNELWEYNIEKDSWKFIKPYIESTKASQQKPYPRIGHSAVYYEVSEQSVSGLNFIRKYMFIYGGYSIYCQHSCEDMWSYEISYGPQRFYPDSKYFINSAEQNNIWEKGNKWNRIYPLSYTSPGKRALHSMTIDSEFKYIYLFGGYSVDEESNVNILKDDLWRYHIQRNTWEKLNIAGIYSITRIITYWDGSSTVINVSPKEYNQATDTLHTTLNNKDKDSSIYGSFPVKRGGASLTYSKRADGTDFLLLFGGFTYNVSSIYNIQYILNDLWIYSIGGNSWLEVFPNGEIPEERYGHQIICIEEDNFLLFGGINSQTIYNDLWSFNSWSNLWVKTKNIEDNSEHGLNELQTLPYPAGFFSMVKFKYGIIIYGGLIWKQVNESLEFYKNYKDEEELLLNSSVFNTLENLYILYSNKCKNDCSGNGNCHFGICFCNEGFWGEDCKNKICPKSLCFIDHDFHIKQECIHCSGNGQCSENGECLCDEEYTGEDCSIRKCLNDCSGEPYGRCILRKPASQCECNQELKRGGDDCSLIFCLNNCGDEGICDRTKGNCRCSSGYYGEDCSVYVVGFRAKANNIIFHNIFILFYLFLFFN